MSHISINIISFSDSFGKKNPIIEMTKFRIDTYQHLVGEMWIYTPHINSNPFNCKDTTPPVVVNIEILDIGQEWFSHL
jgi:hypothetical protein